MKKFVLQKEDARASQDFKIEYRDLLNTAQFDAVMHNSGPALVIAGAGTGKTRTLIYRVARLIESGVDPKSILLLTFTRRAAGEMLRRASMLLDDRCRRVEGGTFHRYCSKLLHIYSDKVGYPENFTIIDSSDAMDTINLLRGRLSSIKQTKRFPKKSTLYSIFSTSVNKTIPIHDVLEKEYPQFKKHTDAIQSLFDDYNNYKKVNYVMDFDDLLVNTRDLLRDSKDVREKVAYSHKHVMVDEYQDTNSLQAELTELFSSVHNNVVAVGDDAQSIYSFRGAEPENMQQFPERFEGTKLIKLEENYRSTQRILDLANRVLSQSKETFKKELFTNREEGELPGLVKAANVNDQSRFLTQMILNLREQGRELSDMAVLFRNGRDSYDLEVELNKKDIPFVKFGGQKFTEAAHVKDVLAHLKIFINPQDTISWNRALMLMEGIGPKTAEQFFQWAQNSSDPFKPHQAPHASDRYLEQLRALSNLFSDLKQYDGSVPDQLKTVVEYYSTFCKKRFDDHPKRMKDLETFVDISGSYRSLQHLIEEVALDPIEATAIETEAASKDESPLVLSTIHSAKGLEWRTVFLIQCLDGIIPSGYAIEDPKQMEEEIRLVYVAVTRAKDQLFLTYPAMHQSFYGDYFTNPSRFIEDIPDTLLEPWMLVEEPEQPAIEDGIDTQLTDGK
ncbi:ATP-dependent helicase [Rhodohalobacter sp. 8-1]|uniref:ATP-dependent helicase n=1 Tax=Rhodohalobacter sp. 8-1 TaxID=3131972 RepID=UPI0030EE3491